MTTKQEEQKRKIDVCDVCHRFVGIYNVRGLKMCIYCYEEHKA